MNWLAVTMALSLGILPGFTPVREPVYEEATYELPGAIRWEAEVLAWDRVFVSGEVETTIYKWDLNDTIGLSPALFDYDVRMGFRFPGVEIYWHHFCSHADVSAKIANWRPEVWDELGIRLEASW